MKHIRRALTVTIPILAIGVLYMILFAVLPIFGVHLCITNTGESMEPNMHFGAFSVWVEPKVAPFDELKVGDIIIYRERKQVTSGSFAIGNTKKGSTAAAIPASTDPVETENIETESTEPAKREVQYYPGKYAMHRVYEVNGGEVFTWGDGNPEPDDDPVIESGYVGKVVWYVNYVGRVFQVLCSSWCFSILSGLTAALLMLKKLLSASDTPSTATPPSSTPPSEK